MNRQRCSRERPLVSKDPEGALRESEGSFPGTSLTVYGVRKSSGNCIDNKIVKSHLSEIIFDGFSVLMAEVIPNHSF